MKWLLLAAGIPLLYFWLKGKRKLKTTTQSAGLAEQQTNATKPEAMVQCQHCSVHLPRSEAIPSEDRYYCSQKHLLDIDPKGWLGSAHWRISPNQNDRPNEVEPDLAVLHHISLPPGEFEKRNCTQYILDFFQNTLDATLHPYFDEIADQQVSSHFLISRDGEVFQFVSTKNNAWHAGISSFLGREKCNDFSIGIELEGDGRIPFEECQYEALTSLSRQLLATYPKLQFAGHSDIAPGRKVDPGIQFDWQKFQTKTNTPLQKLPFGLRSR